MRPRLSPVSFHPLRRSLVLLALAAPAFGALAQAFPTKMVTIVVPYPPGGPTDTASRIVGQKMAEILKQQFIIENKAGASGSIAAAAVAKAPADGYTLMMLATPTLLAPHLYKAAKFDIQKDFTPVGSTYDLPIVMVVNPNLLPDVTTLPQLIAKAKASNPPLNYTSSGQGSFGHLTTESLKVLGKFEMSHVPYRGGAPAVSDVIGGQVPVMYADMVAALPHIQSGKLRAIAVGSPQRVPFLPDVKTVSEQGFPGFDAVSWGGLLAPAGTPAPVINKLNDALKQALSDPATQDKLKTAGVFAAWQSPKDTAERIRRDDEKWGKVVRDKGVTID
ncbi:tripartite tricarboxylate transporter substrate binding protein [Aquincola sp. MAHUQ-54]|uniref:Tripartite tricarboxylate transporter substrate binding protein n=1 Tax=Aquincola agrisoli TaxID=3119538 RepID=A0AAW9QIU9_9BURK